MSIAHPIISVTGSSGAGTTSVKRTFEQIFRREGVNAAYIEGDAFHRYDLTSLKKHSGIFPRPAPPRHDATYTMPMRPNFMARNLAHSQPGKIRRRTPIFFSTKACMALSSLTKSMSLSLRTSRLVSCQSSILNGYRNYTATKPNEAIHPRS